MPINLEMIKTLFKVGIPVAIVAAILIFTYNKGAQSRQSEVDDLNKNIVALQDRLKSINEAANKADEERKLKDKQHEDSFNKAKKDANVAKSNLNTALERLRYLEYLPKEDPLSVAGPSSSTTTQISTNSNGMGTGIKKYIGACESTGSDPCYTDRTFFENALDDARVRNQLKPWAVGQNVSISP
jgi:hypothetical protein